MDHGGRDGGLPVRASYPLLEWLTTGRLYGVPHSLIVFLVVTAVMAVVLHRSVFGRHLFAVGRNEEAARYSGIDTRRVVVIAYVICSGLTALSAVFIAMYTRSISPSSHGNFYELYAIAAAVLGGCSLRGGQGSIAGVVLGTVLLQMLQNLVNLLGVPSSLNFAVMGSVILLGVLVDRRFQSGPRLRAGEPAGRGGRRHPRARPQPTVLEPRRRSDEASVPRPRLSPPRSGRSPSPPVRLLRASVERPSRHRPLALSDLTESSGRLEIAPDSTSWSISYRSSHST